MKWNSHGCTHAALGLPVGITIVMREGEHETVALRIEQGRVDEYVGPFDMAEGVCQRWADQITGDNDAI